MIKVTFKEPQTFLDDKCKDGKFTTDEVIVQAIQVHPKFTIFTLNDLDLSVLTKSIDVIKPNIL